MLRDKDASLYRDRALKEYLGVAEVDLQPYGKRLTYWDGTSIDTTHRIFTDRNSIFDYADYMRIDGDVYKILTAVQRGDHTEACLFKCTERT